MERPSCESEHRNRDTEARVISGLLRLDGAYFNYDEMLITGERVVRSRRRELLVEHRIVIQSRGWSSVGRSRETVPRFHAWYLYGWVVPRTNSYRGLRRYSRRRYLTHPCIYRLLQNHHRGRRFAGRSRLENDVTFGNERITADNVHKQLCRIIIWKIVRNDVFWAQNSKRKYFAESQKYHGCEQEMHRYG
jgi:hypothetical protein